MPRCIKCKKEFSQFTLMYHTLCLCKDCIPKAVIELDHTVDETTHKITCPKCKAIYYDIADIKCRTQNCNVWFVWDDLMNKVIAKWVR